VCLRVRVRVRVYVCAPSTQNPTHCCMPAYPTIPGGQRERAASKHARRVGQLMPRYIVQKKGEGYFAATLMMPSNSPGLHCVWGPIERGAHALLFKSTFCHSLSIACEHVPRCSNSAAGPVCSMPESYSMHPSWLQERPGPSRRARCTQCSSSTRCGGAGGPA